MNWKPIALVIVACSMNSGCCSSLVTAIVRNVVKTPIIKIDQCAQEHRSHILARHAWQEVLAKCPGEEFSHPYKCGFLAGYADYLQEGGTGDPPPVPPLRYQLLHHQSREGEREAQEWFAGFRHGAGLAKQSGQREWVLVPLSGPWPEEFYREPYGWAYWSKVGQMRRTRPEPLPKPQEGPPAELLPPPRVEPEEGAQGPVHGPIVPALAEQTGESPGLTTVTFSKQAGAAETAVVPAAASQGLIPRLTGLRPPAGGKPPEAEGPVFPRQP
jgi:hypothetical protein